MIKSCLSCGSSRIKFYFDNSNKTFEEVANSEFTNEGISTIIKAKTYWHCFDCETNNDEKDWICK